MTLSIHRDGGRIVARGDGRDLAVLSRSPHGLRVAWSSDTRTYSGYASLSDLEQAIIEAFERWELAQ